VLGRRSTHGLFGSRPSREPLCSLSRLDPPNSETPRLNAVLSGRSCGVTGDRYVPNWLRRVLWVAQGALRSGLRAWLSWSICAATLLPELRSGVGWLVQVASDPNSR